MNAAAEAPAQAPAPVLKWLGRVEYESTWRAMQRFTESRDANAPDELWFLEHPPVFTLGMNTKPEHLLAPGNIPVVQIDRGGQVTYHGPGQLVVYPLIDLRRAGLTVRDLVVGIENAIIALCAAGAVEVSGRREAPGVYANGRKLASVGLRIKRGCSYHGLALNVAMDLEPFQRINPCGYAGLQLTDLRSLGLGDSLENIARRLAPQLLRALNLPLTAAWN